MNEFENSTHLHDCVMKTNEYPSLNKYIDVYLTLNPQMINKQKENGWTALMIASRYSNKISSIETVKILLKHKPDLNIQNKKGWTVLMEASMYSKIDSSDETVELLLKHGANINMQNNMGYTALTLSVEFYGLESSEKTIEILLKYGADANIQNEYGSTALFFAIFESNSPNETVKMLLKYNANVHILDKRGINILFLCIKYPFSTIVIGYIIAAHVNKKDIMNITDDERKHIIDLLHPIKTNKKNKIIEAFQNHLEIEYAEDEIIQKRIKFIKLKDNMNVTPLYYPRITKSKLYDMKFVRNVVVSTMRDLFLNF